MKIGNQINMARKLVIVALLSMSSMAVFAQDALTESSLLEMRQELKDAGEAKDFKRFFGLFAPKARVTLKMPANKGGAKQVMNLAKFKKMIKHVWSLPAELESKISGFDISIEEDGQSAMIKNVIHETVKINGDTIRSKAKEKFKVVLINGKPTIKSLKVNVIKQY
jgi:hypothetical protein